jgi:ribulose-phosphate 3-epimerase
MCAELSRMGEEVSNLDRAGVDSFHVDIMDGHFVPNLALTADVLAALRPLSVRPFCVHAMVEHPQMYVEPTARAGGNVFIFHIEAVRYPRRLMREVENAGMIPGIAINPATPVEALQSVADARYVLVLTVEPGFAGQDWIVMSPARVRAVAAACPAATSIAVDGHVDMVTAPILASAGANVFVCGTGALFHGPQQLADYAASLAAMREAIAPVGPEASA